jgi:hypothetical protein
MAVHLDILPPLPNAGAQGSEGSASSNILALTLDYGPDTAATAQDALRAIGAHCSSGRPHLLIDLRMATDQSEGARVCYRHTLVHLVDRVAIVVGPNVSRFLGEFLALALRNHHDVRLFVNEDYARSWLSKAE